MHAPPDQRAVGSPQALTPLAGFDVAYHNRQLEEQYTAQSEGDTDGTEYTLAHAA